MPFFPLFAEIARQAAQMKLMRKLEKQALARAAKEARKQQGKLTFFCVCCLQEHRAVRMFAVFLSVGQSIKTCGASGYTHSAYRAFVCMYVHIYFHHFKAQALIFFLL